MYGFTSQQKQLKIKKRYSQISTVLSGCAF